MGPFQYSIAKNSNTFWQETHLFKFARDIEECIYGRKPYDYAVEVDNIIPGIQRQPIRSVYIISLLSLIQITNPNFPVVIIKYFRD